MKKIKFIVLFVCSVMLATSCDYLDIAPTEVSSEEEIFSDIKTAELALGRIYWSLYWDHGSLRRDGFKTELGACTDEMYDHWETPASRLLYNNGAWGASNNPLGEWKFMYNFVRRATVFIDNIDKVELKATQIAYYTERVKQYKEEARFFRAYFFFDLFRQYGAIPLPKELVDISNVENTMLPRASVSEVIDYICSELDIAAGVLPDSYSTQELGRITKGACLALKARALLYVASPLYNGNKMYADQINSDGTPLFPQDYNKELWKRAAEAAQAVIDWAARAGIVLEQPNPSNPVDNYARLFYDNTHSKEIILPGLLGTDMTIDQECTSNSGDYGGYGKFSVLQEMVDAYETKDGYLPFKMDADGCVIYDANGKPEINPESGYTETGFWSGELYDGKTMKPVENISNMYKDRDPRFYASISFQGTYWKSEFVNRPLYYAYWLNNSDDNFEGNKKLVGKSNETGYGIRKWMDPNINLKMSWRTSHHYPLFRLAEQYLNCAEAWNEYLDRPDDKVYSAINAVRNRVGMPSLPITEEDKTQAGMRKRIRNERRVELFYENHRFYDVRRWMIAKKVDGSNVTGMNSLPVMDELEKAAQASGLNLSVPSESKQVGLSVFYKRSKLMKRVFEDKHYLFPIPQTEIDKNKNLVQNHGW